METVLANILVTALIILAVAMGIALALAVISLMSDDDEEVDERAKKLFNGRCPYTNKECKKWTCSSCKVEKRERKWTEREDK